MPRHSLRRGKAVNFTDRYISIGSLGLDSVAATSTDPLCLPPYFDLTVDGIYRGFIQLLTGLLGVG